MYVQDLEFVFDDRFKQLARQGQFVGLVMKQGIFFNEDLMKKQIGTQKFQSDRLMGGNKMDLMTFF
jgi:hypothetical protein